MHAFVWTDEDGFILPDYVGLADHSEGYGASDDLSIVVGEAGSGTGFIWKVGESFTVVSDPRFSYMGLDKISGDGLIVAGHGSYKEPIDNEYDDRNVAFSYPVKDGIVNATLMKLMDTVNGMSRTGDVVVGVQNDTTYYYSAVIWTKSEGESYLIDYLKARNVDLSAWSHFKSINHISSDARYISGVGITKEGNEQVYVVDFRAPRKRS